MTDTMCAPLRARGWVEGQNLIVERRYASGNAELLKPMAQELVRLNVELIVANGTVASLAAKRVQVLRLEEAMKLRTFATFAVSALFGLFIGLASAARNDIDGDGKSDVLWRNIQDPQPFYLWRMSGSSYTGEWFPLGFQFQSPVFPMAIGDLDGNGTVDIVSFDNVNGDFIVSLLVRQGFVLRNSGLPAGPPLWVPVGFGDLNGDGHKDILWSAPGGGIVAWLVAWDGVRFSYTSLHLADVLEGWAIKGVADIDGDGIDDIIWFHQASESVYAWLMTPAGEVGSVVRIDQATAEWSIQKVVDFDGDGKADILWRACHPGFCSYVVWYLNGTSVASVNYLPDVGTDWKIIDFGDYDGDGKNDILWQHSSGAVFQWLMAGRGVVGAVNAVSSVASSWQPALTQPFCPGCDPLP